MKKLKLVLDELNNHFYKYRWLWIIISLVLIGNRLSSINKYIEDIWNNVAEIETTNEKLDDIKFSLLDVQEDLMILQDIESETSAIKKSLSSLEKDSRYSHIY